MGETMKKRILFLNDFPCFGMAALPAMMSVTDEKEFAVYKLPTLLLSNTFNYGCPVQMDTTDFLAEAMENWEFLGVCFDAIATGFPANFRQTEVIADFCGKQQKRGALIFCDPVFGDHGKLYRGLTEKNVEFARELIATADYATPNYTEACMLTGMPYQETALDGGQMKELLKALCDMGVRVPVITSVKVSGGKAVVHYDAGTGEMECHPYEEITMPFYGAGDRFLAVLTGRLLKGNNLSQSVQAAMDAVSENIRKEAERRQSLSI